MEDFVWVQAGLRESLILDLYIIPASGRLFHGRDFTQLRNLTLHNVSVSPKLSLEGCHKPHVIPGFDDFMVELSRSMVTTMPNLETVLISFRLFHGPITYNRAAYVEYDRPSVLRMWGTLHDAYRQGIYGLVERDRQGEGRWIVPRKVLVNWGALLAMLRRKWFET